MKIQLTCNRSPEAKKDWNHEIRIRQTGDTIHVRMDLPETQFQFYEIMPRRYQAAALITIHSQKPPFPEGVEFFATLEWPNKDSGLEQPETTSLQNNPDLVELECFKQTDWWNHLHLDFPERAGQLLKHWQFRHHSFPSMETMLCLKDVFDFEKLPEDLKTSYQATQINQKMLEYRNAGKNTSREQSKIWTEIFDTSRILWTPELFRKTCNHTMWVMATRPPECKNILDYEAKLHLTWRNAYRKCAEGVLDDNEGVLEALQTLEYPEAEIKAHPEKERLREYFENFFRWNMPSPGWFLHREKTKGLQTKEKPDLETLGRWLEAVNTSFWNQQDNSAFRHYAGKENLETLRRHFDLDKKQQIARLIARGEAPKAWIRNPASIESFYYLYKEIISLENLLKNPGWGSVLAKHQTSLGRIVRELLVNKM